jgi:hypothetical protein
LDKNLDKVFIHLVILTRDRPRLLKIMLESIFNQQTQADSILVSDNSVKYLNQEKEIQQDFPKLNIEYKKRNNLSASDIYNTVFKELEQKQGYAIIVHDDDYLHPSFVKKIKFAINKYPNQKILSTNSYSIKSGIKPLNFPVWGVSIYNSSMLIRSYCNLRNPVFPAFIYHHSAIQEAIHILNSHIHTYKKYADMILVIELVKKHNLLLLNKPLYYYRFHGMNDSASNDFRSRLNVVKYLLLQNTNRRLINQFRVFNLVEERKFQNKEFNKRIFLILLNRLDFTNTLSLKLLLKYILQA